MHKQQGVTLVEVLVTIVILSVALLGLAALQAQSLKTIHASESRVLASLLTRSYAEALSANHRNENYTFQGKAGECQATSSMKSKDIKAQWVNEVACTLGAETTISVKDVEAGIVIALTLNESYLDEKSGNYIYTYFLAI